MADTRKTPDAHEGPRALPEERWEHSAEGERRLDDLLEDGIPPRDAAPAPVGNYGDDTLPPELKESVRELRENVAEQSRVGMADNGDER
jgi:hypothetical protein